MLLDRQQIRDHLTALLVAREHVRAAWEGGSAAFGQSDQWSDVDLVAVVADDEVAATFEALERGLEELGGVAAVWQVPEPTPHGHAQRLYRLKDANSFAIVDVVVQKLSAGQRFLDARRHGTPRILVGRDGLIRDAPPEQTADRLADALAQVAARRPVLDSFVLKEIRRERPLDALTFFHRFELAPLITLLRARHCPERFDFGMRYLAEDLPADVHDRLLEQAWPPSFRELEACSDGVRAWIDDLLG